MKIRDGFVSNSSSSSFVVALDKCPESEEELEHMLFKDDKTHLESPFHAYIEGGQVTWTSMYVAETLFNTTQVKASDDNIKKAISESFDTNITNMKFPRSPAFPDIRYEYELWKDEKKYEKEIKEYRKKQTEAWHKYDKEHNLWVAKCMKTIAKKFKNKHVVVFSFSDNDGTFSAALEHGDVFEKVPFIRFSHH